MTLDQPEIAAGTIHDCVQGNADAWERMVRATYPAVLRHLRSLTRNPEEAKDLAQETFLRLMEPVDGGRPRLALYRPDRLAFEKFLRVVAYRTFLNARSSWNHKLAARSIDMQDLLERFADPGDPSSRLDCLERWRAVDALPPRQKSACLLFACGWSYEEIASLLGIGAGGTAALLHRARQALTHGASEQRPGTKVPSSNGGSLET